LSQLLSSIKPSFHVKVHFEHLTASNYNKINLVFYFLPLSDIRVMTIHDSLPKSKTKKYFCKVSQNLTCLFPHSKITLRIIWLDACVSMHFLSKTREREYKRRRSGFLLITEATIEIDVHLPGRLRSQA